MQGRRWLTGRGRSRPEGWARRVELAGVAAIGVLLTVAGCGGAARGGSKGRPAPSLEAEGHLRDSWYEFMSKTGPGTAKAFAQAAHGVRAAAPRTSPPSFIESLHTLSGSADALAEGLAARGPDPALVPYAISCIRVMAELFPEDTDEAPAESAPGKAAASDRSDAAAEHWYDGISDPLARQAMEAAVYAEFAATRPGNADYRRFWIQAALPELERAAAADPNSWRPLFELGWAYYDLVGDYPKAIPYFEQAAKLPGSPSYVYRMRYRMYEYLLDFPPMFAALEEAKQHHPEDKKHQEIVARDIAYWKSHQDDAEAHRRIIIKTSADQLKRGAPLLLYPGNPFWVVCPHDGMPSPKGSTACKLCGRAFD